MLVYLWNSCLKNKIWIGIEWQINKCSKDLSNLWCIRLLREAECNLQGTALKSSNRGINWTMNFCSSKKMSSQFPFQCKNTNQQPNLPGRTPFDVNPSNKSTTWTVLETGLVIGDNPKRMQKTRLKSSKNIRMNKIAIFKL